MTKPAGCFLQLLGVGALIVGAIMLTQPEVPPFIAGMVFVGGIVLIYAGGRPARRRQ
jgi:membrane protein implicated in regulation of membrane protease activity